MTLIFPKWTNRMPLVLAVGAVLALTVVTFVFWYWFSPKNLDVGYQPIQPVPYSHKLHAGLLGFDCRYCHQGVEKGPHALVPATETCINCHAPNRVKGDSPRLQVVRDSAVTGDPIVWKKVHLLPDFVYFNHAAHVNAAIGCVSCHGRIDQMEIVRQAEPLSMSWCIDCHRHPENHLRPREEVTNMEYVHDQAVGERIKEARHIQPPTHCSGCHR